ncbi:hypothetical protein E2R40_00390 [Rathayibacter toxicus]|nr:hypothetical protein E2R33_00410 [Rathayibacter toxicus]QWL31462.1 hypothetical protein E2R35_00390 [Rathayibacter toxicus]QWL33553.1 hypothetical protein E2R36_00390 [Rathayibacter toxicus]QWL35688.1 hypothetical protein E2R37_00390 [Rathayibacter toxicus]QWL37777.1 hypothetical protein E2R38_00390 [Rathayibacter toxicus]
MVGCVVHSDRGSQFRSRKFLRALTHHRLVGSMSRAFDPSRIRSHHEHHRRTGGVTYLSPIRAAVP